MKLLIVGFLLLLSGITLGQKKIIGPDMYEEWKSLSSVKLSNDGRYISYEIKPLKGDGYLYLYNTETGSLDSMLRATGAIFSGDSRFLVYTIKPGYDTLRTCELDKIDKKKWPKDSLGILLLEKDSLIKISRIKSFKLSEEGGWLAYQLDHNELDNEQGDSKKKKKKKKKSKESEDYKSDGNLLYLFHPDKNEWCSKDVRSYELSKNGNYLAYTTHRKYKCDSVKFSIVLTDQHRKWTLPGTHTDIQKFSFDDKEEKLAYLFSDDSTKTKVYSLSALTLNDHKNLVTVDTNHTVILEGDAVSINFEPIFTKDGSLLFFGVSDKPVQEPKDTLTDSEKVKLDVWSYNDYRLQPQQNISRKHDLKKTDKYVYHFDTEKVVMLCGDSLDLSINADIKGDYLLGRSDLRYASSYNWDSPRKGDYYRISVKTGNAELLKEGARFPVDLAPSGKKYIYYDQDDLHYKLVDAAGREICVTCGKDSVVWTADMNGMPMQAYPLGVIGWDKTESIVYLQSEFDVWQYDMNTNELSTLGMGEGIGGSIEIRPMEWSADSVYVDFDNVYFKGLDKKTKGTHLYKYEQHTDHWDMRELAYFDADIIGLMRSKNKKKYVLRKMTFEEYPEVYAFDGDPNELKRISVTNPQQSEYNWGTVELIKWKSYKGIELEGLLYKPENYDPKKEYPLMVYYYELYSDRLHRYYSPKPTASIIYPTEYASAGYIVFIPDIRYTPGHPAKSAYDCIMSGTDKVLELLPNVDSTRMGLQGQSWGGYQTAQMVTMTNRYRAAMAGAPVANMFSAYGGIRWGSGMNRQFQYERTQSRIGYTIWEKPELYIENSPLFHLPNVHTPLLIMHNDHDDAVPWYQGIELFTGLTRLNKEVWLLNYNDDKHNLRQLANKIDLSIRMRQFFDHYLLDQPAPRWMIEGVPAIVKGKEMRYELIEEPNNKK